MRTARTDHQHANRALTAQQLHYSKAAMCIARTDHLLRMQVGRRHDRDQVHVGALA